MREEDAAFRCVAASYSGGWGRFSDRVSVCVCLSTLGDGGAENECVFRIVLGWIGPQLTKHFHTPTHDGFYGLLLGFVLFMEIKINKI